MKKTDGERLSFSFAVGLPREVMAKIIDRLVARRQAEAWDAGEIAGFGEAMDGVDRSNPYRKGGRGKR